MLYLSSKAHKKESIHMLGQVEHNFQEDKNRE